MISQRHFLPGSTGCSFCHPRFSCWQKVRESYVEVSLEESCWTYSDLAKDDK